jgi:hypothetical protein
VLSPLVLSDQVSRIRHRGMWPVPGLARELRDSWCQAWCQEDGTPGRGDAAGRRAGTANGAPQRGAVALHVTPGYQACTFILPGGLPCGTPFYGVPP